MPASGGVITTSTNLRAAPLHPPSPPLPHCHGVLTTGLGDRAVLWRRRPICVEFSSFIAISLWGLLLPPSRLRVHHPHQDRGGLPPAERCDRVWGFRPWPEGAHHLGKPQGQRVGSPVLGCHAHNLCTLWLASCGRGNELGMFMAVAFGQGTCPAPQLLFRGRWAHLLVTM